MSTLPDDALVILPARNVVLFPGLVLPLVVARQRSIEGVQEAVRTDRPIGVVLQRAPDVEDPGPEDLHRVGTVATIIRYLTAPDGTHHVICQGQQRFRIDSFVEDAPVLAARVTRVEDPEEVTTEIEARAHRLREQTRIALELLPEVPAALVKGIEAVSAPGQLADMVAGFADFGAARKQEILETFDVRERLDRVLALVAERIEVLRLSHEIGEQTKASLTDQQRQHLLREQMKSIQEALGEGGKAGDIEELGEAIGRAGMPPEAEAEARKELARLQRMPEGAAEYSMTRTYLDWLLELPWNVVSEDIIDLADARRILDADHYGLEKVKRRILEYLAVRKLNPGGKSPVLCLVGPPGVGKTSLGQSIARATGRKFVRVSLGGTHDEAEIRGHRRTYVGAMPGNVIQAIRRAGTRNPVFMLDELDKLGGGGLHGDPSSALLEVLDPEQNATFRDNYLGVPFDLSRVMFLGTANVLHTIPSALRDRLEVIELPGYTEDEKLEIARRYLVGRQLEANGLTAERCELTDDALHRIICDYTREAGCRNLEREIGGILRHVAVRFAEGATGRVRIDADDLPGILGPAKFENELALRTSVAGVATGLAWTPTGGDVLFVEANRMPGGGKLILTGQLGDVMKESAQAALTLVRSNATALGLAEDLFERSDIHIHVPAGAIPKDGPSAGVAIYVALVSLLTGRRVRSDVAMTGEISLRGVVLPVGGIKEKVVAAARAGVRTVLLPERNRKDLEDIPASARAELELVWVGRVEDAVRAALEAAATRPTGSGDGEDRQVTANAP
jgi:ATP-dependent Lon protease